MLDKLNLIFCSADVPDRAKVSKRVAFPHNGAPKLGNNVWVGVGTFMGGSVYVADNVIVGANSVLVKSIKEPGVIVAGVPAKVLRKLTPDEIQKLRW